MKLKKFIPVVGLALLVVGAGVASPASADTTQVSGSLICPVGQNLYVHVTSVYASSKIYYLGSSKIYTSDVTNDSWFSYGTRGGNWKVVDNAGNIKTVTDGCTSATATLVPSIAK